MSLFFRNASGDVERRDVSSLPWIAGGDRYGGRRTYAGETVTTDKALRVDALWSAVNLLTNTVSDLPVDVYRGRGGSRVEVSPQPSLVASPSLLVSRREWTAQAMMSLLLRGNAYGVVLAKDQNGRPQTVEWAHPDCVEVDQEYSFSPPEYKVSGDVVPLDRMMHLRAFVLPGSAVGLSPVEYHKQSLGISLAGQKYGGQWFGDGAHPSAIFQNTAKTLVPDQVSEIKQRFMASMRGKREPAVVGSDWKYTAIQVSPSDSALLDTLEFTDAQTCRIFGPGIAEVLGYKTGGSLDYTTRIDRTLDLLQFTVNHWVVKFEDALTAAIAGPQYVKYNVDSLLRSDPKTRWEIHAIARGIGAENVDEIRDHEDMRPLPNGEGQDYTPLKSGSVAPQGDPNAG